MGWLLDSFKTDCRHYVGEKPCKFKRICLNCPHFSPMGKRILVLKLGAAGDALRTTPILREFKAAHGQHHVTWVTDKVSYGLLKNNPYIDRLMLLDWGAALEIQAQKFDVLYSADKFPAAVALAALVDAPQKLGFTLNEKGTLDVFDENGTDALFLGLCDPFKFRRNDKTYQQTLFEMFALPWNDQEYVLELTEEEHDAAAEKLEQIGATKHPIIGLNTGAGTIFATKKWPSERFVELARALKQKMDCTIVILGGPGETKRNAEILAELGQDAIDGGCDNPVRVFAAMVAKLDAMVTADTLAMHLAIAGKVPTVALFGPTTPIEVSMYDNGVKLTGTPDCAPCYKAVCKEETEFACMNEIEVEQVLAEVEKLLGEK